MPCSWKLKLAYWVKSSALVTGFVLAEGIHQTRCLFGEKTLILDLQCGHEMLVPLNLVHHIDDADFDGAPRPVSCLCSHFGHPYRGLDRLEDKVRPHRPFAG